MSAHDDILAGTRFFVSSRSESELQAMQPALESAGLEVRVIRGDRARSLADFMNSAAGALAFPDYFGKNWNAFDECLDDLAWLPQRRYVITIVDADDLLADASEEDRQLLMRVLVEAFPQRDDTPGSELKIVFQVKDPDRTAWVGLGAPFAIHWQRV